MHKWLDDFKLALIKEDLKELERLHFVMPDFKELDELKSAKALIAQAITLFTKERNKVKESLDQQKKVMQFQKNARQGRKKFDKSF